VNITGERAKHARGISPSSLLSRFTQYYLVAMATSVNKSENTDPSSAYKELSCGEKIAKIGPVAYVRRYSTKYASFLAALYRTLTK